MKKFEKLFPKQARDVRECTVLTNDIKAEFFALFDGRRHTTKSDMEFEAKKYFREHKFLGAVVALRAHGERLGRLHEWSAVEGLVFDALDLTYDKVASYRDKVTMGDMNALDELLDRLQDESIALVVWCFRNLNGGPPFKDISLDSLPCRLGLDKLDIDDYFPIEINVPTGLPVRRSTAFDGAYNEYWCPGGTTCPREECSGESGLPEVVAPGSKLHVNGLKFKHAKSPDTV